MHRYKVATRLAQANFYKNNDTGELIPPISLSTSYERDDNYEKRHDRSYIRDEQLNLELVEDLCANIEYGQQALLFSSGSAAIIAPMVCLKYNARILIQKSAYFGFSAWLEEFAKDQALHFDYFDIDNTDQIESLLTKNNYDLFVIETPSNPLLRVLDIEKLATLAHNHNTRILVDSTVATPMITNPILLGADYVGHSVTKFINGHHDVLAGVLVSKYNRDDMMWNRIARHRFLSGCIPCGFTTSQILRGMRSLSLRMERHCNNTMALANFLNDHHKIDVVHYPGLPSHPDYQIAVKQMRGGFGGMLSFQIGHDEKQALSLLKNLLLTRKATSLGGMETLAEHRHSIEGNTIGTPKNLIRVSVGIEDIEDIIDDFDRGLKLL